MKKRVLVAVFITGCFVLIAILGLDLASHSGQNYDTARVWLLVVFGLAVAALVYAGIFLDRRERWTAFLLAAISVLLFSFLSIFSIGIFIAPFGLALLGLSLWKLSKRKPLAR